MILYTSDLHFGHSNVIRFDLRPFADRDAARNTVSAHKEGNQKP